MNSTIPTPTHKDAGTGAPRLQVDALAKTYGSGPKAVQVIEDLTFSVNAGEMVCIVGPSGVGKPRCSNAWPVCSPPAAER